MKKHLKRVTVFLLIISVFLFAGCKKPFDAKGYTQAVLDMITRGDTEAYEEISQSSKEEAKKQYEAVIDSYMQEFDTIGFSEGLEDKYREYVPDLMKKTKYTVREAKEQDDGSFEVAVEVEPVIMIGGAEEELKQKFQEYITQMQTEIMNGKEVPSDAEITETIGEMLYESLNNVLENPQYGEKSTITVHVQESETENVWEIPTEDIDALVTALVDTTGAEQAFSLS